MFGIHGRALHFVFKIGNRAKNAFFFRNILGMVVLRHEEFTEGCAAQCNGPYDNRWSKTMIGYGPESSHFVFELTYNYGVNSYNIGNDFGGVIIRSKETLQRAVQHNYPITVENDAKVLVSPDGYKFYISEEPQSNNEDPVAEVILHTNNLRLSKQYWSEVLTMSILAESENFIKLSYGSGQAILQLKLLPVLINRANAYGRIAFAVARNIQPAIDARINEFSTVLTPLTTLDTPGKAAVQVIILADPNGHEICLVDEEGFSELSQVEAGATEALEKYIKKDPFQPQ